MAGTPACVRAFAVLEMPAAAGVLIMILRNAGACANGQLRLGSTIRYYKRPNIARIIG